MDRRAEIERHLEELSRLVERSGASRAHSRAGASPRTEPGPPGGVRGSIPLELEILAGDPPEVRDLKREIAAEVKRYQEAWREIENTGAVLKDPRTGLLDFYGEVDGTRVWLCWKYGEDAVTHYHGLDEGFSGRKLIEPLMRRRHLN
jgi:hypothetical protein